MMEEKRFMAGITTVTFNDLTPDEIISISLKAGLQGIEWNARAHILPGEIDKAREVGKKVEAAGLLNLSYGSYYRLGEGDEFTPVLQTALAMGAPMIRIWAGSKGCAEASEEYRTVVSQELRDVCKTAEENEISIALEYHRNSLTDDAQSALSLLNAADCKNLRTYWQMNPDISHNERLREIEILKDKICALHIFTWTGKNVRHPLDFMRKEWIEYLSILKQKNCPLLFEFVKDDSPEQLIADAESLRDIIKSVEALPQKI